MGADGEARTSSPVLIVDRDEADAVVPGPPGELLVLWSDHSRTDSGVDSYGRRFDASLQPIGERFVVSDADGVQEETDAVFDGERYAVAWADTRNADDEALRGSSPSGPTEND